MKTVEQEQFVSAALGLPPGVQDALGELAGAAKDGLRQPVTLAPARQLSQNSPQTSDF